MSETWTYWRSENHHADIGFEWGYCCVTFASHERDLLTENGFICAAKIDSAMK
jgi:pterin-4a-carbinolamine dehydratase